MRKQIPEQAEKRLAEVLHDHYSPNGHQFRESLVDLITDIFHFCARNKLNVAQFNELADQQFRAEQVAWNEYQKELKKKIMEVACMPNSRSTDSWCGRQDDFGNKCNCMQYHSEVK